MTRSVDDLAADVRASFEKLRSAGRTSEILKTWCDDGIEGLAELVALAKDESDLEHQSERRAYWRHRAVAAETSLADTRRALDACGDLLFGVWDDDEEKRKAHREAEALTRRALAGPAPEETT